MEAAQSQKTSPGRWPEAEAAPTHLAGGTRGLARRCEGSPRPRGSSRPGPSRWRGKGRPLAENGRERRLRPPLRPARAAAGLGEGPRGGERWRRGGLSGADGAGPDRSARLGGAGPRRGVEGSRRRSGFRKGAFGGRGRRLGAGPTSGKGRSGRGRRLGEDLASGKGRSGAGPEARASAVRRQQRRRWRPPAGSARRSSCSVPPTCCWCCRPGPARPRARPGSPARRPRRRRRRRRRTFAITMMRTWRAFWSSGRSAARAPPSAPHPRALLRLWPRTPSLTSHPSRVRSSPLLSPRAPSPF